MEQEKNNRFLVNALCIVFDSKEKKVLIGRRENDEEIPELTWSFPGARIELGDNIEEKMKKSVKEKTGYDIESLGTIYARVFTEKEDLFVTYFLCEVIGGKMQAGGSFKEVKWVKPKELEEHFTTSFPDKLKEYILDLE
jgi:ADP-ribose pyrophosphatase YjhB (NUDIX family)